LDIAIGVTNIVW